MAAVHDYVANAPHLDLNKLVTDSRSLLQEKVADSSSKPPVHIAGRPSVPPYSLPALPIDDDEISSKDTDPSIEQKCDPSYAAIGGPTGELLETNAQVLSQISTNLGTMQIQDNISLLCQTRDNILRVLKEMNDAPEIMKQMPPLPVKINEELVNSILPRPTVPMQ
ncbi:unnamed protein product [Triticum turgidum subsp. durum]|uniref:Uncharacterized protein n=1 Tax=Triticum turgidum subsp. durum TaxID=4567 RepID=A0A9R1RA03_TRITD|nr:unnamed protein product [Triticum turgidum subsp. durum]